VKRELPADQPGESFLSNVEVGGSIGWVGEGQIEGDEAISAILQHSEKLIESLGGELTVVNQQDLRNFTVKEATGDALVVFKRACDVGDRSPRTGFWQLENSNLSVARI
jgi:hypothetical protein